MASRLFRVDLSASAADFHRIATEPGLPMLDPAGTNYAILRRWLGDLVAEPEPDRDESMNFYARDDVRGRLEVAICYPATKEDLKGTLRPQLEAAEAKLKKAKPGSSTEQVLHNLARRILHGLATDDEQQDQNTALFKYRDGKGTWRLVWCWGYQRSDAQPATPVICTNPDCNQLFVQRPKTKARCPGCQGDVQHRPWRMKGALRRAAVLLLAALLAAGGLMLVFGERSKLVVTPAQWSGPAGSRVNFQVNSRRWLLWNDDVTSEAIGQSHDRRVIELEKHGRTAKAKWPGQTLVTFRYQDRVVDVPIDVGSAKPPESITIEPDKVDVAPGESVPVNVVGHFGDGSVGDVSELVEWESSDREVAIASQGKLLGIAAGDATLTARYPSDEEEGDDTTGSSATATVKVADVAYKKLEVNLDPVTLGIDERGAIEVDGVDSQGKKHRLAGSPELHVAVEPASAAVVRGDDLVGKAAGPAKLVVKLGELSETFPFMVAEGGRAGVPAGTFNVAPQTVELAVGERMPLDVVATGGTPIESVSSDPAVVYLAGATELVARKAGSAEVTVSQGDKKNVVKVTVRDAKFTRLRIEPRRMTLAVGTRAPLRVVATTVDGRDVEISPQSLSWIRQPLASYAELDRAALELTGKSPTPAGNPEQLIVGLGDLQATATVEVVGRAVDPLLADDFLSYPPIDVIGRDIVSRDLGNGLVLYPDGRVVVGPADRDSPWFKAGARPGSVVTRIGGDTLVDLAPDEIVEYFRTHPLADPAFEYIIPGETKPRVWSGQGRLVQDVVPRGMQALELTDKDFRPEVQVALREPGEYRLTTDAGEPLGDWAALDAADEATLRSSKKIPRTADDEYELWVERKSGDKVKQFKFPGLRLKPN